MPGRRSSNAASRTTPRISTILPTFGGGLAVPDDVTPCAARVGGGNGPGSRLVSSAQSTARTLLRARAPRPAPRRPRAPQPGGEAGSLDGRRHTGRIVEVFNPRRDGGQHRMPVGGRVAGRYAKNAGSIGASAASGLGSTDRASARGVGSAPGRSVRSATTAAPRLGGDGPTASPAPRGPRAAPPWRRSRRPGGPSGPAGAASGGTAGDERGGGGQGPAPAAGGRSLGHAADRLVARPAPPDCASRSAQLEVGELAVGGVRAARARPLASRCLCVARRLKWSRARGKRRASDARAGTPYSTGSHRNGGAVRPRRRRRGRRCRPRAAARPARGGRRGRGVVTPRRPRHAACDAAAATSTAKGPG